MRSIFHSVAQLELETPGIAWPTFRLCIFHYLFDGYRKGKYNQQREQNFCNENDYALFCEIPEDRMYKDEVQNDHFSDNSGKQLQRAQKCRSELVHY